jgi:hypothetical protein
MGPVRCFHPFGGAPWPCQGTAEVKRRPFLGGTAIGQRSNSDQTKMETKDSTARNIGFIALFIVSLVFWGYIGSFVWAYFFVPLIKVVAPLIF